MKRVGVIFGLLLLISIGFVMAEDFTFEQMECQSILQYKSEIIGIEIPEEVPLNSEIINLYLSENIYGHIVLENKVVEDFDCTENEEATYDVFIKDEQTLWDIYEAEDVADMMLEKFSNKEIKLKGKTFSNKIKAVFARIGLKIFSWFN